jgi:hypothetical protein
VRVIFAGVDWAEAHHDVCVMGEDGRVLEQRRAAYSGPVNLSLSAADPGGVGVAKTYWTADGSTPSTSSGVYQTPLSIGETETIKYFSVDNAGNREKVKTITVRVG